MQANCAMEVKYRMQYDLRASSSFPPVAAVIFALLCSFQQKLCCTTTTNSDTLAQTEQSAFNNVCSSHSAVGTGKKSHNVQPKDNEEKES
jgi:hypothetical protein